MTIDEAIDKYKNRVEQYKDYPNMADIAKEHEQLVDWLCELKEQWASRGELTDFWYLEGYNKGIEEFAERLKAKIDASYYEIFLIDEIAESMKGEKE